MKNPERDEEHRRRRGNDQPDTSGTEDEVDGREVAEALYGGLPTDSEKIDDEADGPQQ